MGYETVRVWVVRWWIRVASRCSSSYRGSRDSRPNCGRTERGRRENCISCTKSDNTMFSCTDVYRSYKFCSRHFFSTEL